MECGKFIICGEDKKSLGSVKNALVSNGHIFIGYSKEPLSILRHIRSQSPDFVLIEVLDNFIDLRRVLDVIDEEILCVCILVFEVRIKSDDIWAFLRRSRVMGYITKPVFDEVMLQVVDNCLMNFRRVQEYELKVRQLNDTLESRKLVEKAKWILVEKDGMTETQAYELLKRKSRDNRISMKEIAEALILTRG